MALGERGGVGRAVERRGLREQRLDERERAGATSLAQERKRGRAGVEGEQVTPQLGEAFQVRDAALVDAVAGVLQRGRGAAHRLLRPGSSGSPANTAMSSGPGCSRHSAGV